MAIIDDLPGVKVEITVDGTALTEYEDHDTNEDERTVTRYVEAVSDQVFAISLQILPDFEFLGDCMTLHIYADGNYVDGSRFKKKSKRRSWVSEGQQTRYVSDGRTKSGEVSKVKDLGSIKIKCIHKDIQGPHIPKTSEGRAVADINIVSEKALKGQAISHNIAFTTAEPARFAAKLSTRRSHPISGVPNPAATFVFRYRSYAALKSMLIIPRTPSPPPLEDRDITTLNQDELRELQRRAQAFRIHTEAQLKIEREREDDNTRQRRKARPSAGNTQLGIEDDGSFWERSTSTMPPEERLVIELD